MDDLQNHEDSAANIVTDVEMEDVSQKIPEAETTNVKEISNDTKPDVIQEVNNDPPSEIDIQKSEDKMQVLDENKLLEETKPENSLVINNKEVNDTTVEEEKVDKNIQEAVKTVVDIEDENDTLVLNSDIDSASSDQDNGDQGDDFDDEDSDDHMYDIISEGKANIYIPAGKKGVFYNPVQEFNRDLSVTVLTVFAKDHQNDPTVKKYQKKMKWATATSETEDDEEEEEEDLPIPASIQATKLSSSSHKILFYPLRLLDSFEEDVSQKIPEAETTNVKEISNDTKPNVIQEVNNDPPAEIDIQKSEDKMEVLDENKLLEETKPENSLVIKYNLCDDEDEDDLRIVNGNINGSTKDKAHSRDSPNPVHQTAQSDQQNVTSNQKQCSSEKIKVQSAIPKKRTAMSVQVTNRRPPSRSELTAASRNPLLCYVKYNAVSLKTAACHEMALRICLHLIETVCSKYGRFIVPLLSFHADFYIRVFVKVFTSPQTCKATSTKTSMVFKCIGCNTLSFQPLGMVYQVSGQTKFNLSHGPVVNAKCAHCDGRHVMAGPIWTGPLHDAAFVTQVLKTSVDLNLKNSRRITGMLAVILEELKDVPLYYTLTNLCSVLHCEVIPMQEFKKTSMVFKCIGCNTLSFQPLGMVYQVSGQTKFNLSHGPVVNAKCAHCDGRHVMAGPIWTGPLHDAAFVTQVLKTSVDLNLKNSRRITGMLAVILEELKDVPLYYTLTNLCSVLHCEVIPMQEFRSALLNANYKVSLSHCSKNSFKTNAPMSVVWDILRCWIKLHPIAEKRLEDTTVRNLLQKEPQLEANFSFHEEAISESAGLLRYQPNPEPFWGPGRKSTTNIGDARPKSNNTHAANNKDFARSNLNDDSNDTAPAPKRFKKADPTDKSIELITLSDEEDGDSLDKEIFSLSKSDGNEAVVNSGTASLNAIQAKVLMNNGGAKTKSDKVIEEYNLCDDEDEDDLRIVNGNIKSALLNANYKVSLSHCSKNSFKTNAPMSVVWDILRCWIKLHPIAEKRLEDTTVRNLLQKEPQLEANFSFHEEAISESAGLLRYQPNPEPFWGPGRKSTTNIGDARPKSNNTHAANNKDFARSNLNDDSNDTAPAPKRFQKADPTDKSIELITLSDEEDGDSLDKEIFSLSKSDGNEAVVNSGTASLNAIQAKVLMNNGGAKTKSDKVIEEYNLCDDEDEDDLRIVNGNIKTSTKREDTKSLDDLEKELNREMDEFDKKTKSALSDDADKQSLSSPADIVYDLDDSETGADLTKTVPGDVKKDELEDEIFEVNESNEAVSIVKIDNGDIDSGKSNAGSENIEKVGSGKNTENIDLDKVDHPPDLATISKIETDETLEKEILGEDDEMREPHKVVKKDLSRLEESNVDIDKDILELESDADKGEKDEKDKINEEELLKEDVEEKGEIVHKENSDSAENGDKLTENQEESTSEKKIEEELDKELDNMCEDVSEKSKE
ncbi:uncharacterized protein LOC103511321 [Diaphorina citri]|uniref:tRNA (guanine(26)-N(2))-dimethyltransferase n=1 Tax=Diaphorina citri TaxID=121845 RepID=A0A3Q0IXF2_DIACI|nr:uncharacterized protein LOC103511321 [Diaphorina citri]